MTPFTPLGLPRYTKVTPTHTLEPLADILLITPQTSPRAHTQIYTQENFQKL